MRLYIGNLPYKATEADLESFFSQAGIVVDSVNVVRDRFSGEARGFGFAEISNEQEATRAISGCNGKQLLGRPLVINEARPMASGGGAGAGGGGGMNRGARGAGGGGGSRRERY
jgi:RNA recognition motif-containing protein